LSLDDEVAISVPRLYRKRYEGGRESLHGDCALGQLTSVGAAQHASIGAGFKQRYLDAQAFPELNATLDARQIFVRATDVYRTQQSAQSQLNHMFSSPPTKECLTHVITVHTVEKAQENMAPNEGKCPYLHDLEVSILASGEWPAAVDDIAAAMDQISHVFRTPLPPASSIYERAYWLVSYADTFRVMDCHGEAFPAEITPALREQLYAAVDVWWRVVFSNETYATLAVGEFLVQDLTPGMAASLTDPSAPKFSLFSGHDTTIAPLLGVLQLPLLAWPPLASQIVIELYRHAQTSDAFLRIIYNGKVVLPPFCTPENGHSLCTWREWEAHVRAVNHTLSVLEGGGVCNVTHASADLTAAYDALRAEKETLRGIVVLLVFALLCVLISAWVLHCKRKAKRHIAFAALNDSAAA
jgi:hypothetical protein